METVGFDGVAGDLSIWSLVLQADPVVKLVMLVLVGASVWCWAIIFFKSRQLRRLRRQADAFEETFWSGGSLEDLYERTARAAEHPMVAIFNAAMHEWLGARKSLSNRQGEGLSASLGDRIDRVMAVMVGREMEALENHLGFLATVGSTAPFIGLFGTVWGIMNSFQSIAVTKNTSLAVVAPGIAEALLATALGLVAAIPAVVAYNKLSQDLARYAGRLEGFSGEFGTFLSRQISERVPS